MRLRIIATIRILVLLPVLLSCVCFIPPPAMAQAVTPGATDVYRYVHRLYIHGIPYSEAHEFGPQAAPELLALLQDPSEAPYWVNVIVTIGFIGDTTAVEPLTRFLAEQHGELDVATFRALLSVPFALGCLAFAGSDAAYAYLVSRAEPSGWRELAWTFQGHDASLVMAEQAIMSLGVSGRPEAVELLERTPQRLWALSPAGRERLWTAADEAMRVNTRIREEGPEEYFGGNNGGR